MAPHTWTAERLNKIAIFVSKISGDFKCIDKHGIVRTIDNPGIDKLLATSRIGNVPEVKRGRAESVETRGNQNVKTSGTPKVHGGIWQGRENERQAAAEHAHHLDEVNNNVIKVLARPEPYNE